MAQHDYVIDNQASAPARADLNSLFQAIASQNSGATAPATTYANQIWYDTSTDLLKMRNEANSGWITLGTIDQTNNVFNPNFLPATQVEAEAGTNNIKGMTPLRVAQAVAALGITTTKIQVFTASGTYTPTSGYKYAIAIVTGGGAGGTGAGTNFFNSGGTGGGTVIDILNLSSIGTPTITVGAGGGSSTAGGTSSIGTTLSAYGGGQTVAYTGLVQIQGGSAMGGFNWTTSSGRGGMGGGSFWGSGGHGTSGAGIAAVCYGAGGGGGANSNSGGAGKSGIVMIMEFK